MTKAAYRPTRAPRELSQNPLKPHSGARTVPPSVTQRETPVGAHRRRKRPTPAGADATGPGFAGIVNGGPSESGISVSSSYPVTRRAHRTSPCPSTRKTATKTSAAAANAGTCSGRPGSNRHHQLGRTAWIIRRDRDWARKPALTCGYVARSSGLIRAQMGGYGAVPQQDPHQFLGGAAPVRGLHDGG